MQAGGGEDTAFRVGAELSVVKPSPRKQDATRELPEDSQCGKIRIVKCSRPARPMIRGHDLEEESHGVTRHAHGEGQKRSLS